MFAWVNIEGIDDPNAGFTVSILAVVISFVSFIIAGASYFFAKEKFRTSSVLAAYVLLVIAIGVVILQTGQYSSPFLVLWIISAFFSGIFGIPVTAFLLTGLGGYTVWAITTNQLASSRVLGILLAGLLPLLISYVLWHGKASSDKTKDKAFYDLENKLNQVANKADVVIGAISDGVIAINNKQQIELINAAAQRLVGWKDQDALHLDYKSVLQLLSNDGHELDNSKNPILEVLTTNQPKRRNDLQLLTSSGKKITVEVIVSPIGRLGSGAIIVFRDITKELVEERAQAEFISTASHEMRTPVASIEGYLGLVLNPATAQIDDKAREFITKAHASAQHLGRLLQDLLDVTKADDGRLSNNPKVIDLVVFVGGVIEELNSKAQEKGLRLFFKPATDSTKGSSRTVEPVFFVNLDADHLHEVVINLVENAIKYTPAGEVVVDIKGDDDHVVVSITDSGIGIPTEDIPHLFQKFYRVDNSDTREIGGTGLGLYLCRRLTETMGGRIWVESEYKKGSTFSVELPRISHTEANHLIDMSSPENGSGTAELGEIAAPTADENDDSSDIGQGSMPMVQRAEALKTPIITDHKKSLKAATPTATQVKTPQVAPQPPTPVAPAPTAPQVAPQPPTPVAPAPTAPQVAPQPPTPVAPAPTAPQVAQVAAGAVGPQDPRIAQLAVPKR
ncbi:MAG: PAS domain-containing protein [Candidatus Nomurabacteria bacterium]|nr:MAG: PAS domain-containing protein [Candidatus Nomurabacteria bacterium]